jgi:amino acid transporter
MGSRHASLMAVFSLLKLVLANSALALAISSYLMDAGMPRALQSLCWLLTYGAFTLLDAIGVKTSEAVQIAATIVCVAILVFYVCTSLSLFSMDNIRAGVGGGQGAVINQKRSGGAFRGFPFALQFFDGFEELPLLMGESRHAANACNIRVWRHLLNDD